MIRLSFNNHYFIALCHTPVRTAGPPVVFFAGRSALKVGGSFEDGFVPDSDQVRSVIARSVSIGDQL